MKFIKIIFIFCIFSVLLSACKSEDKLNMSLQYEEENLTPKEGGEINISMVKFSTLNPLLNKEKSVDEALKLVYDPLFSIDENNNVSLKLAKGYDFSYDFLNLNIKLKDDIYWHSGDRLTADDVAFTINYLKSHKDSPYSYLTDNISSVSTFGYDEVEITFAKPYAFSLETLIFPIIQKSKFEAFSNEEGLKDENNLVGNGMYKIKKYDKRKCLYLEKNDKYYEKKPYIDKVNVLIVPDKETQENMLLSQDVQICRVDDVISGRFNSKKFNKKKYKSRKYEFIAMNFNNECLKNLDFRKALAHSIDKKQILNDVYINDGELVNFPISSTSKYYNENIKSYKYDLEIAKNYIKKSELNEQIKASIFNIIVNQDDFLKLKTAYLLKDYLTAIGINSQVTELASDDYVSSLYKGEYDFAICGWTMPITSDPSFMFRAKNNNSFINYTDDSINSIIDNVLTSNESKLKDNYDILQKYVNDNVPFISLLIQHDYLILNNSVKSELRPSNFNIYNGIENIFVKD